MMSAGQQSQVFLEPFKSLSETLQPDSRNLSWVSVDMSTGEATPLVLHHVHAALEAIQLSRKVPAHIYHSFLTARHLALYSWFVYRFEMIAQLQAYATLEYALRDRLGYRDDDKPPTLRPLLNTAIKQGLLKEPRLRDWPGHQDDLGPSYRDGDWLRKLPELIAYFRNVLAHGSYFLMPDGGRALRLTADIINQLYPE